MATSHGGATTPSARNLATQNPISAAAAKAAGVESFGLEPEEAVVATPIPIATSTLEVTADDAMTAVKEGLVQSAELQGDKKELTDEIVSIQESIADATANKAKQDNIILTQQATAALQTQNDARRVFQSAGGVDQLVKLAVDQKETSNEAIDQIKDVSDLEAVTISDDGFFSWLSARFQLGGEISEANAAINSAAVVNNAISNFTAGTNKTKEALSNVSESRTVATVAALTESNAQQATILAGNARLKARITRADQITEAMTATRENVDAAILGYNLSVRKDEIEQTADDRAARKMELGKSDAIDAAIITGMQNGQIELGLAPDNEPTLMAMVKMKGDAGIRASSLFNVGTDSSASSASNTLLAYSIHKPIAIVNGSNASLTAVQASANSLTVLEKEGLTAEQLVVAVDNKVKKDFERFSENIKFSDSSNPNTASPLPVLLAADSVKDEKLVVNVLAGMNLVDASPEQLLKIAVSAVEDKKTKVTMNDARDAIVAIYKQAVHLNNTEDNRKTLSFPIQKSYVSNITLPKAVAFKNPNLFPGDKAKLNLFGTTFFGDVLSIDFLNPTDVMSALVKFKALKASGSSIFDKL